MKLMLVATCFVTLISLHGASAASPVPSGATASGIPIDTVWKEQVYRFAVQNLVHPSWGLAHSERDYQTTRRLAAAEGVVIDLDVLFAVSFLHDLGGMEGFAQTGVDHGVRSAELAEPLLKTWGFDMRKWPEVKAAIVGHIYYGGEPADPLSRAFRDADILDFLGTMGIARIFAVAQESSGAKTTLKPSLDLLKDFVLKLPPKLSMASAKKEAVVLVEQMSRFFKEMDQASLGGQAL